VEENIVLPLPVGGGLPSLQKGTYVGRKEKKLVEVGAEEERKKPTGGYDNLRGLRKRAAQFLFTKGDLASTRKKKKNGSAKRKPPRRGIRRRRDSTCGKRPLSPSRRASGEVRSTGGLLESEKTKKRKGSREGATRQALSRSRRPNEVKKGKGCGTPEEPKGKNAGEKGFFKSSREKIASETEAPAQRPTSSIHRKGEVRRETKLRLSISSRKTRAALKD